MGPYYIGTPVVKFWISADFISDVQWRCEQIDFNYGERAKVLMTNKFWG